VGVRAGGTASCVVALLAIATLSAAQPDAVQTARIRESKAPRDST
jgi:hypothetical protein